MRKRKKTENLHPTTAVVLLEQEQRGALPQLNGNDAKYFSAFVVVAAHVLVAVAAAVVIVGGGGGGNAAAAAVVVVVAAAAVGGCVGCVGSVVDFEKCRRRYFFFLATVDAAALNVVGANGRTVTNAKNASVVFV